MPQKSTAPQISLDEEYRLLHDVADVLQSPRETGAMLHEVLRILTGFEELNVESKAGVFLADPVKRVLKLHTTYGEFTDEFLEKEQEVPYGDCLCGRAAESGKLLMSDSCFSDMRHERTFEGMTPHGHYIIPLISRSQLVGVLFLYTQTHPTWYRFNQEVLLSIGSLIAGAIERQRNEEELDQYRRNLETVVEGRTAELTQMREQLRQLNHRLETVREEEKKRISREVHDQLGQSLTALSLDLAWLGKRDETRNANIQDKLESMHSLVQDTIKLTQKIASDLRPQVLDVLGLSEALQWQARQFSQRTGIACHLNLEKEKDGLDAERSTAIFRIFQEALTNISRHAEAKEVHVSFQKEEDTFELIVSDDGRGMDPEKLNASNSLGLMGIRERTRMLGGNIHIDSSEGNGTAVRVNIPARTHEN